MKIYRKENTAQNDKSLSYKKRVVLGYIIAEREGIDTTTHDTPQPDDEIKKFTRDIQKMRNRVAFRKSPFS